MIATVNHIIDNSFVDGPGNRTVIFFQGCNFHCAYCHNPETISLCTHCGQCVPGCPTGALTMADGKVQWNKAQCIDCGQCYKNCSFYATPRVAEYTVDQLVERIRRNLPFIRGITVSGGECTLQRDFIVELFRKVKKLNLGTLLDSNGGLDIAGDQELMAVTDGVMLDIKGTDKDFHQRLTGQSNQQVLRNAVELAELDKLYEIRTVILANNPFSQRTVEDVGRLMAPYLKRRSIRYKLIKFRPVGVRGEATSWVTPSEVFMEVCRKSVLDAGFADIIIT